MEIIIFQLLSCLYFDDSGMEVPVNVRKLTRYTGVWRAYKFTQTRYTGCWRRFEACGKPVYRRPASKGLIQR